MKSKRSKRIFKFTIIVEARYIFFLKKCPKNSLWNFVGKLKKVDITDFFMFLERKIKKIKLFS